VTTEPDEESTTALARVVLPSFLPSFLIAALVGGNHSEPDRQGGATRTKREERPHSSRIDSTLGDESSSPAARLRTKTTESQIAASPRTNPYRGRVIKSLTK